MSWCIDKSFTFEAGHRVWSQKLDTPEFSLETECACKHLHGHSYTLKVFLESEELNRSGMVTDFKNLNWVKQFLDDTLDHKFIIDVMDPNFKLITGCASFNGFEVEDFTNLIDLAQVTTTTDQYGSDAEVHRKSFVLVNWVPTSENICKHLFFMIKDRMKSVCNVKAVELWETAKSHCRYQE